jgi:predicted  nucleic acid-binding Zn-ribbon protein
LYDKIDEVSESMSKLEEDLYKRLAMIDTKITALQNAPKPQPTTVQPCECDYPDILKRINDLKSELSSVQSCKCDYPGMLKSINDLRSELSGIRSRMGGIVKGEVAVHEGTAGHVAIAERSIKLLTDELTTLRNNFRNLSETTDRRMADRIGRAFGELAVRMDSIEKKISMFEKQLSNEQLTHPIIIE